MRKRFVSCHEVVHTFFEEAAQKYKLHALGRNGQSSDEESLCDLGAAELLMPDSLVRKWMSGRAIDVALVREASSVFNVSLQVASRRLVDCAEGQAAVVHWNGERGFGRIVHLIPHEYRKGLPPLFREATPAIQQCYEKSIPVQLQLRWVGSARQEIICESIPLQRPSAVHDEIDGCVVLSVLRPV